MGKQYYVITPTGLPVYGPNTKAWCIKYIKDALRKGSEPGFLSIVNGLQEEDQD